MIDFVVMVCYYGAEIRPHRELMDAVKAMGVPFCPVYDCPYLDIARSYACTVAMEKCPEARGFVFLDHDMHGCSAEDIVAFARRAIQAEKDVVGVAYSLRRPGFMLSCQPLDVKEITFYVPGYEKAKWVGTGFTFISRKVLEMMRGDRHFVHCLDRTIDMYFRPFIDRDGYHPDDIGFSYRVRRNLGLDIWIDTEPRILHRGAYDYAIEDSGLSIPNYKTVTVKFDAGSTGGQ